MTLPELPEKDNQARNSVPLKLESGYVTLPFEQEKFEEFIVSLLGKPQTFEKVKKVSFIIHLRDIQNLHDLLQQRVIQQNNGSLIQVVPKIFFSDNSSIEFSSLEELLTYNEVRSVFTKTLDITWIYLIQFGDKSHPEKQEITVNFDTESSTDENNESVSKKRNRFRFGLSTLRSIKDILLEKIEKSNVAGKTSYLIRSTNRGWTLDIANLLDNYIIKLDISREEPFLVRFSGFFSALAGYIMSGSLMILLYRYVLVSNGKIVDESRKIFWDSAESILRSEDMMEEKILSFINLLVMNRPRLWMEEGGGLFIGLMCFYMFTQISPLIEELIRDRKFSVILISSEDNNRRTILKKTQGRMIVSFILSILFSIIAGIMSNYIFAFLTR